MTDNAVVIGSGSAGRRHALALRRADPDLRIVVVRRSDSHQPIDALRDAGISTVASIDEVPDAVTLGVVASPATFHRSSIDALAPRSVALLLEKPVATTSADAVAIRKATAHMPIAVGYHLRCTDTIRRVRDLVSEGAIGEPSRFDLSTGQHLDLWRPAVDARTSVSARTELGGGVLNELSHEIDAVAHLLGDIASVSATLGHTGAPTDGNVDTVADLELLLTCEAVGTVHLDMVSDPAHRRWNIGGEDGVVRADFQTGRIERTTRSGTEVVVDRSTPGERDRAEDRVIANLLAIARGDEEPLCTLDEGIAVVAVIEAARRSAGNDGVRQPVHHPIVGQTMETPT